MTRHVHAYMRDNWLNPTKSLGRTPLIHLFYLRGFPLIASSLFTYFFFYLFKTTSSKKHSDVKAVHRVWTGTPPTTLPRVLSLLEHMLMDFDFTLHCFICSLHVHDVCCYVVWNISVISLLCKREKKSCYVWRCKVICLKYKYVIFYWI